MAAPIVSIGASRPISAPSLIAQPAAAGAQTAGLGFSQVLHAAIAQVSQSSDAADSAVQNYLSGGNQELHSMILAGEKASIDFELLLQVRNKVVSAYEEIMRMQI